MRHIIPTTKAPRLRECKTRYGPNQNSLRSNSDSTNPSLR